MVGVKSDIRENVGLLLERKYTTEWRSLGSASSHHVRGDLRGLDHHAAGRSCR